MDLDGFALHVHLRREVEPVKPPKQELLKAAYAAFNRRDLETALALLHPEVEWAKRAGRRCACTGPGNGG